MSVDIDPEWLGDYGGGDSWEGGARRVRLWRDEESRLRFAYNYEQRGNHGYTLRSQSGTVIDVSATAITVEVTSSTESAWEDLFKMDNDSQSTTRSRQVIEITRIENGKPVLDYGGALRWRSGPSPAR